ncbi:MAG: hypothetical protein ACLRI7_01965 [Ruthenibacterium lactatiformans]
MPVVILAGVLAVSTFRAQQREDAARQAHTAELAARTLDAEFKRVQGLGQHFVRDAVGKAARCGRGAV